MACKQRFIGVSFGASNPVHRMPAWVGKPLDKKGAGSRILGSGEAIDAIDAKEMKRQPDFTSKRTHRDGTSWLGLRLSELRSYLDVSFERATGRRRPTDRTSLMGEWHVLVKVMGKAGSTSRYPSLSA